MRRSRSIRRTQAPRKPLRIAADHEGTLRTAASGGGLVVGEDTTVGLVPD